MALLIFLVGLVLGWFVRPPRRAELATNAVGFGAFVVLSVLWAIGHAVSPLEAIVLLFGTPLAGLLASWVARRRLSRRAPAPGPAA